MRSTAPESMPAGDTDLIARAAGGDERAMAALYDRYGQVLYAVAYRIVGQRADAEEVVLDSLRAGVAGGDAIRGRPGVGGGLAHHDRAEPRAGSGAGPEP